MSRSRNIKPGFFKNELLVELAFEYRLLFIGLWTMADRAGRLEDRPTKIRMELFPADDVDVNAGVQALHEAGFVLRYEADGRRLIQVLAWAKHQNPHIKEAKSALPAPDEHGASTVQAPVEQQPGHIRAGLIPDSGFLIPDSGTSHTTEGVAGSAAPPGAGTQLEGSFEGHTGVMVVAPNPVAPFAIALNNAGFRCTPMNPDLIAYVGEGGRVDNLLACAAQPECKGKPATYVIRFARRELATVADPVQAGGGSSLSAVDQIEAHIRANRARDEQGPALEGESVRIAR